MHAQRTRTRACADLSVGAAAVQNLAMDEQRKDMARVAGERVQRLSVRADHGDAVVVLAAEDEPIVHDRRRRPRGVSGHNVHAPAVQRRPYADGVVGRARVHSIRSNYYAPHAQGVPLERTQHGGARPFPHFDRRVGAAGVDALGVVMHC